MYEGVIQHLIDELGRLPGVGPKGAQRIAFYLLAADPEDVRRLAAALMEVTERVRFCRTCGNVAEAEECRICLDTRRDPAVICVVEEPKDVAAVEKIREFRGRYHVLGGAISPIDGIGPDDLRVKELMTRLADGTVTELILATDPNRQFVPIAGRRYEQCDHVADPIAKGDDLITFDLFVAAKADIVTSLLGRCHRAVATDHRNVKEIRVTKRQHCSREDRIEKTIRLPPAKSAINAAVVDFLAPLVVLFDGQFLPLASQVQQFQNIVE